MCVCVNKPNQEHLAPTTREKKRERERERDQERDSELVQQKTHKMDRQALSRATDSSDAPPPGYLFNDIAKSASSSPAAAQDVATYLVRRLNSKNNPTIKYKCLKVMQMVAENPLTRGGFKRVLVQDSTAVSSIKSCLGLRGPPDAVHGDAKFEKVRNQAKETLDAIYSDDPVTTTGGMGSMSSGGYGNPVAGGGGMGGGYGSSGYGSNNLPIPGGGGMGSNMGGPKKMEGIGNPMFADPRIGQDQGTGIANMSVGEVLKTAKEGFKGIIKDPLARNVPGATMGANGVQPGTMPGYGSSSVRFVCFAFVVESGELSKRLGRL